MNGRYLGPLSGFYPDYGLNFTGWSHHQAARATGTLLLLCNEDTGVPIAQEELVDEVKEEFGIQLNDLFGPEQKLPFDPDDPATLTSRGEM